MLLGRKKNEEKIHSFIGQAFLSLQDDQRGGGKGKAPRAILTTYDMFIRVIRVISSEYFGRSCRIITNRGFVEVTDVEHDLDTHTHTNTHHKTLITLITHTYRERNPFALTVVVFLSEKESEFRLIAV